MSKDKVKRNEVELPETGTSPHREYYGWAKSLERLLFAGDPGIKPIKNEEMPKIAEDLAKLFDSRSFVPGVDDIYLVWEEIYLHLYSVIVEEENLDIEPIIKKNGKYFKISKTIIN